VVADPRSDPSPVLKVVTFNVRFALEAERAGALLGGHDRLRDADVVVLQEMDAPGVARIAAALRMSAVYYPAAVHHRHGRDFGNAVLARAPISADAKIPLPHPGRLRGMNRIAVAATVNLESGPLRVYSVHLGAASDLLPSARLRQVEAILADARPYPRVVVAGDFNERDAVGVAFEAAGYAWATRQAGATVGWFSWDHVFGRGLAPLAEGGWGVVDAAGASDHRAVWAAFAPLPISTARRTAWPPVR
jgi:endonuclease/exonuclease/phosphatase family metal-dependent hydrolase